VAAFPTQPKAKIAPWAISRSLFQKVRNLSFQVHPGEPITARIRRRTETISASDLIAEADVAPETEAVISKESMQISSLDPSRFFQERIILERQRKDDGPSPP
jgi:hypothetical protein